MKMRTFDRHHYLNMVYNISAESDFFTSADYFDNVREAKRKFFFFNVERAEHPEQGGMQSRRT